MRSGKMLIAFLAIALCAYFALPQSASADDGAAVYKTKCSACHGAEGQGKVGPALKGTSLSEEQIAGVLAKGDAAKKPPHAKPMNGLSEDQAKAVAAFVKTLK